MTLQAKQTRFRAYQLGNEGSSFSYFDGTTFTLIEGRLNDVNRRTLLLELKQCNKQQIDTLHITSWDVDHCTTGELEEILNKFHPSKIEYPGYDPSTDTGKESLKLIEAYKKRPKPIGSSSSPVSIQRIDPEYIRSLEDAEKLGYKHIFYNPVKIVDKSNDNSTIKLLRTGSFNVASIGDVEDNMTSARLAHDNIFSSEVDVLILSHHGANNGFTTSNFIRKVRPTIAVCSSNYDNQYEHPKEEIRELLRKNSIPIFTTKTGDVIIKSIGLNTHEYQVLNLISDSEKLSSSEVYVSKKSAYLRHNRDSIRNRFDQKKPFTG